MKLITTDQCYNRICICSVVNEEKVHTLANLLVTLECWTSILEEGSGLDVIYLVYKKAFSTVPHQLLLQKSRGLRLVDAQTN